MKKDVLVLVGFILLSILVKYFTFFHTVIDHDESTYLVIAQEMSRGKLLYKDLLDIKPIGIYALFAGILSINKSIFFIRLFTAVIIGGSAFLLYKIKNRFLGNPFLSICAGAMYIFALTVRIAVSPNTEIYFVFFTLISIYLLLSTNKTTPNLLVSGLFLGIGFIIKYVVLFDLIFCSVYFFFLIEEQETLQKKILSFIKKSSTLFIGMIIPFALVHLYFYWLGIFDEFLYMTYEAPLRYSENRSFLTKLDFAAGIHKYYTVFMVLFYLSLLFATQAKERLFALLWFFISLIGVSVMGGGYHHYMIQCMPAVCFLAPNLLFNTKIISRKISPANTKWIALVLIVLATCFTAVKFKKKFYNNRSSQLNLKITNYLNTITSEDETLFVSIKDMSIINFLSGLSTPDRVIHTTNYQKESRRYTFNITTENECSHIWESNPTYIIAKKDVFLCSPYYTLTSNYILLKKFNDWCYLYKIK